MKRRELKDYVWNFGYRHLANIIGKRFRAENLLILTGNEKVDIDGALKLKSDLYNFATISWVWPILEDTSLDEIKPYLENISSIILFKEICHEVTMKPLINLSREIRRKYRIDSYLAALIDLDKITDFHFASKDDEKISNIPIRKIYDFMCDYDDSLIVLPIGKESESLAADISYCINQFMKREHFNYFTLKIDDKIEGVRKEDLENRRVVVVEKFYNKDHLDIIRRELIEDGYNVNGLMYFSFSPEPYAEIIRKIKC